MSTTRVAQLPKFAVVQVMIDLDGRNFLNSDSPEVRDQFWKSVLNRLNDLYPENVSEIRNVSHVKRTWAALKQRVLQRNENRRSNEITESDRRVLYILGKLDSYDDVDTIVSRKRRFTGDFFDDDASEDGGTLSSSDKYLNTVEPLLDALIVSNGRNVLSSDDELGEESSFWEDIRSSLQWNPTYSDKSIDVFKQLWSTMRSVFLERWLAKRLDDSLLERKVLYLMGLMDEKLARICVQNGMVIEIKGDGLPESSGVCTVVKTHPLDLSALHVDAHSEKSTPGVDDNTPTASSPFSLAKDEKSELDRMLVICQIEREKAQTQLFKAKRRLIEAQIRQLMEKEKPSTSTESTNETKTDSMIPDTGEEADDAETPNESILNLLM